MKNVIIILAGCLFAGVFAFVYRHPIVTKLPVGSARVLSPHRNLTIRIDGQIDRSVMSFQGRTRINGRPADNIFLWIPDASAPLGRNIVEINLIDKLVGEPNSSNMNYDLLGGEYLVQSAGAETMVPYDNVEFDFLDSHLEVNNDHIQFVILTSHGSLKGKTIELVVNPLGD
jgi:hypothetical protein